jgi:cysteine desulfurase / selenocysteine lyase
VNADKKNYACLFLGTGSTSAINRFANKMHRLFPEKNTVLTSLMEHHSNDLPHRFFFKK